MIDNRNDDSRGNDSHVIDNWFLVGRSVNPSTVIFHKRRDRNNERQKKSSHFHSHSSHPSPLKTYSDDGGTTSHTNLSQQSRCSSCCGCGSCQRSWLLLLLLLLKVHLFAAGMFLSLSSSMGWLVGRRRNFVCACGRSWMDGTEGK